MTRLKLHHDGWLALPPAFRRALGSGTGDLLEAELVDGAIVPRPAAKKTKVVAVESGLEALRSRVGDPAPATRRKPEQLRQAAPAAEQPAAALELEPEQGLPSLTEKAFQSELRRKQAPSAPDLDQAWALVRDPRPERHGPEAQGKCERRPFGQVEVKKLGLGCGHTRNRPWASGVPPPRS